MFFVLILVNKSFFCFRSNFVVNYNNTDKRRSSVKSQPASWIAFRCFKVARRTWTVVYYSFDQINRRRLLSTDGHLFGSDATSLVGCSGRLCLDYAAVDIIRNKCSTHFVSNLSVYLSCLLRHSSSSSVKRWFAAQRYYVHKSCVQERRKGTKVVCSVMWTYNIYACDIGTYCDYYRQNYLRPILRWCKQNKHFRRIKLSRYGKMFGLPVTRHQNLNFVKVDIAPLCSQLLWSESRTKNHR